MILIIPFRQGFGTYFVGILSYTKSKISFCGKALGHRKGWKIWVTALGSHTQSNQVPTRQILQFKRKGQ